MTIIFFHIAAQKYPDKAILFTNLIFFIQHETLHFEKLEGADFEYDNSFFQFQPKNTQIRRFYKIKICHISTKK